ncbi:MAG: nucleotidyltransferase domain-containing protein [Bryobacteraceae bacterium]|nr:nucleotidyltransferase domain-containing protein [Bryobacteraceae bacterium]
MDKLLQDLVERLRKAFGAGLESVVLYGSAASGELHEHFSDLNVLCVLTKITPAELGAAEPIFRWWRDKGNPSPLLLTKGELSTSVDCFPVEFHDIQSQHRLLHGVDLVSGLVIDDRYYRAQVEYQLRSALLRLRQKGGGVLSDRRLLLHLMADSVSTFCVLMRHVLILAGAQPGRPKRDVIEAARATFGVDSAPFLALLDLREEKRKEREIDSAATFAAYLAAIDRLVQVVDEISPRGN